MRRATRTPAIVMLTALAGCMSQARLLETYEATAVATATRTATAELKCSDVEGTVLSREVTEPILFGGVKRAAYTIGLRGCGRQAVYRTTCDAEQSCAAARTTGSH